METIKEYDNSKPMKIEFDETGKQILPSSNVPWIEYNGKKTVVNPMILSQFLKYKNIDGNKVFNYLIVKSSDGSNKFKIYVYDVNKGVYFETSSEEFKGYIRDFIPPLLRKRNIVEEVYADLISSDKFITEQQLNNNEDIINFQDGIFNIKTKELTAHSPKYLNTIQIPARYEDIKNASENSPVFDKYMNTLCEDDKQTIDIIMQCMGLAISNIYGYRTKKALFLVGDGNSGKSQIKKLTETFVGIDNVSAIDLKNLNSQFGASAIYGKRLVGSNDMSYASINEMDIFKQATGGDNISIEFKYGGRLNYVYKGFLWFNCNDLPSFGGDKGKWVYDRILPVACNNVIPKEKRDPLIFDKMMLEKNTILKKALRALYTLIQNNFNIEPTEKMKESLEKYEISNNTLLSFIHDYCEVHEEGLNVKTKRSTFNKCYDAYCRRENNNKGKLGTKAMNTTLEKNFGEHYKKSNGIWYMDKLAIMPNVQEEFGIYENNEII